MKKFHISLSTEHFDASVTEYTKRLGCAPDKVVTGRYARWRTDLLNFTLSCKPGQKGGKDQQHGKMGGNFKDHSTFIPAPKAEVNPACTLCRPRYPATGGA